MLSPRSSALVVLVAFTVSGCSKEKRQSNVAAKVERLKRSPGAVMVAAAGDISQDSMGQQARTADLVMAGDYDAVILMGDNQYPNGTLETYQQFFHPTWGRFKDRIYPSPGNHEYRIPGATGYFAYFGERAGDPKKGYYSFDLGSWHLVSLNSSDGCRAVRCDADSEQVKWLEEDLKKSNKQCTLAYWHHPRFSSGPHSDFAGVSALWNTLRANGVDLVLTGHDHIYERFQPLSDTGAPDAEQGMASFIVGTGGAGTYPMKKVRQGSLAVSDTALGVLTLALSEGAYAWDFVALEDTPFSDQGAGKCR